MLLYYGTAYALAVEKEWCRVTKEPKDSFWKTMYKKYGMLPYDYDKTNPYNFNNVINDYHLNKDNIDNTVKEYGFEDKDVFKTVIIPE